MSKELKQIKENIIKDMKLDLTAKETTTPFGKVYNELRYIQHVLPMKKGEILATVVKKKTGKKQDFVWMGIVERYEYNPVWQKYNIFYKPFCDQLEKFSERREQLYRKQWRDLK